MHHRGIIAAGLAALAIAWVGAQERKPVPPADYGKWENLGTGVISPGGRWLAVPITRVDGTSELRLHALESPGADPAAPAFRAEEGRDPAFADDERWLAYRIGLAESERERLQEEKKPIRDKVGLIQLGNGPLAAKPEIIPDVTRFAFAEGGGFLAVQKYAPEGSKRKGADLIVRNLARGTDTTFGNVAQFAWQEGGPLLALAIDAETRIGNGVQLYDPRTSSLRVLDSGDADYAGLAWREEHDDLAAFRSKKDETREGETNEVLAWRGLATPPAAGVAHQPAIAYDQTRDDAFPADMRVVTFSPLRWSDDGATLFFGTQAWDRAPERQTPEGGKPEAKSSETQRAKPATVEVWHARDERIIAMQRVEKDRDRERNLLVAWRLDVPHATRVGTKLDERITVLEGQGHAAETDGTPYQIDNMFDRARQDICLIDVKTGARRKVIDGVWYFLGGSPLGNYLLYFKDDGYWTYDLRRDQHVRIAAGAKAVWINTDYDTPVRKQRPPWGVGGWLKDESGVLLYDRFDVWRASPDGAGATRLTRGAEEEVRHRYVRLDPDERAVDATQPIYFSLYGEWTKKTGYARLVPGAAAVERLIWLDRSVTRLARAKRADVLAYVAQDFDDPPDYFVGGPTLAGARRVTSVNSFQTGYAWGRSTLVEYRAPRGQRLQGALFYPAAYEPGRQYPMIVYVYERLSQGVHGYTAPSERTPYNASVFTAQGYFVLQPDIVFRARDPGVSATECVVAAVSKVLESGMIDPKRVGLVGHSWGGYEASFIPTQTRIFAAAVAGAPLTNFFSFFGAIHWNQGMPETQHFETGQARMEVPYWVDLQAYVRNSPVMFIQQLQTPMLVFFGDKDGTVDWHQGVELYNYARRAGKFLVMLVYVGENHSAREKPNQIDYHRRVLQWFGHFLKGDAAAPWMTEGQTLLDREKEVKRGGGPSR